MFNHLLLSKGLKPLALWVLTSMIYWGLLYKLFEEFFGELILQNTKKIL
jgi:hypothetical protein